MLSLFLKEALEDNLFTSPWTKKHTFLCSVMLQLLLHRKHGGTYIYVGKRIIKHNSYSQIKSTYLFRLRGTFWAAQSRWELARAREPLMSLLWQLNPALIVEVKHSQVVFTLPLQLVDLVTLKRHCHTRCLRRMWFISAWHSQGERSLGYVVTSSRKRWQWQMFSLTAAKLNDWMGCWLPVVIRAEFVGFQTAVSQQKRAVESCTRAHARVRAHTQAGV